ncbi:MAG: hypothetical protein K2K90_10010 [Lachnospiraceae bacterium]|nr:hypothetical protein [Lachnospiraceae bacterium]
MSVNGIGTAGYPLTGYTARKMERSAESGTVGFMETVEEKAAQGRAGAHQRKGVLYSFFEEAGEIIGRHKPNKAGMPGV